MPGIEAVIEDVIEEQQGLRYLMLQGCIYQLEVIVRAEHIEHFYRTLIGNRRTAESHQLVENRQGVTHSSVGFLRHYIERFFADGNTLFLCHRFQISDGVRHRDTVEIIHLATAQNSRKHFVLLRGCQDKDGIRRRFFKGLQQRIKGTGREHVYLINDIDGVLAYLRRYTHLVDERTDIFHGVVARRIEFVYIKRPLLVERLAGLALVASVMPVLRIETVDCLREDTRTSGLPHSTRSAEQIRVRQMILTNGILQSLC